MLLKADRVDTWATAIDDRSGSLAEKLNALTGAGVDLEFVIARRAPEKPGSGVVFVTPIRGPAQTRVAKEVGFTRSESMHTVRVEGPNKPGHGVNIAGALADKGINLRGFTAAGIGKKFIAHLSFDSADDATKALRVLRGMYR